MSQRGSLRRPAILAIAGMALIAVACGAGPGARPAGSSPVIVENLADVSLNPATVSAQPADAASSAAAPSIAPPSGAPDAAQSPAAEYQDQADDFAGFAAAYRSAFPAVALSDQGVDAAGRVLCTYLQRHANHNGTVAIEDAVTEADINQPGFARTEWLTALEIANDHFCGSFSVNFEEAGR